MPPGTALKIISEAFNRLQQLAETLQQTSASLELDFSAVQQALVWVLAAIYEEDFQDFSYGFRPGRSPHDAHD